MNSGVLKTYPLCILSRGISNSIACTDLSPVVSTCADPRYSFFGWLPGYSQSPVKLNEPGNLFTPITYLKCDDPLWQPAYDVLDTSPECNVSEPASDNLWLRLVLSQLHWISVEEGFDQLRLPGLISFDAHEVSAGTRALSVQLSVNTLCDFPIFIAARDRWRLEVQSCEASERSRDVPEEMVALTREFHTNRNTRIEKLASRLEVGVGQILACTWGPETNSNFGALLLQNPLGNDCWNALLVSTGVESLSSGTVLRQEACWLPPGEWYTLQTSRSIKTVHADTRLTWIRRSIARVL